MQFLTFWVTFPIRSENTKIFKSDKIDVSKLIVTGPYRPMTWNRGKSILLEPNPHFTLNRTHKDLVSIVIEKDEEKD